MRLKLLDVLACPKCGGDLRCLENGKPVTGEPEDVLDAGELRCSQCPEVYPIRQGIPRFVPRDNYASSFGYQWNRFKLEQIDSFNGTSLSADRFYTETVWDKEWLRNKWILDAGCGAGRFLDVVAATGAQVVGLDISNAVDAANGHLARYPNVHLVQASIYELPFRPGAFDGCYCIGVIQHTPDPLRAVQSLPHILKQDARLALTIYERKRFTLFYAKYLVRPLVRPMNDRLLLRLLQATMPYWFAITELLFRLPKVGRVAQFLIPIANYVNVPQLNWRQRYRWALLDTFDMLAPAYDQPQTEADVRQVMEQNGITNVRRQSDAGLNLVGELASSGR